MTSQVAQNSNKKTKYHLSDSFSTRLEITGLYIRTMVTRLEITGNDNGTSYLYSASLR